MFIVDYILNFARSMSAVDLALFKKHVRADDFANDDDYLQHLLDTAEISVCQATNRTSDELTAIGGGEFPKPIVHAIMLIAAHWYNQRESVSGVQMHEVPDSLAVLVKPYRKLVEDKE